MSQVATVSIKLKAINAVFDRLGGENVEMLKSNLQRDYTINLDSPDSFTMEELQIALYRLVGYYGANLLIREIQNEVHTILGQANSFALA